MMKGHGQAAVAAALPWARRQLAFTAADARWGAQAR